jgi:hypothetical protein
MQDMYYFTEKKSKHRRINLHLLIVSCPTYLSDMFLNIARSTLNSRAKLGKPLMN